MEEVKLVLKPAYNDRRITKEHYKEILRKTVPKVCTVTLIIFRYALRSVLYFYSFLGSGWVPYKFNCPSQIVKKNHQCGRISVVLSRILTHFSYSSAVGSGSRFF